MITMKWKYEMPNLFHHSRWECSGVSVVTGLSPCFLWWDGSCLNPYLWLFIQHRLFVDSWTVVFLSHARPLTHRCGRGVNFRVQVSLCGLCGGKEGRYHKEEEEDGIGCRFGNKDKETLESFSVVYLVHTTFPFPPSFPSVSLILSHQKWSRGKKGEEFSSIPL